MKKFLIAALVGLAVAPTSMAATATGQTTINLTVPSFVILYYRSSVTITPTAADMATALGLTSAATSLSGTTTASLSAGDANVTTDDAAYDDSAVTGTVNNFWGVRSVGPSTVDTTVSVSIPTGGDTLTHTTSGDEITLSSPQTRLTSGTFSGASVTFAPTGLGAGNFQIGDVRFELDMSDVADSGSYNGGIIEVEASIP